MANKYLELKRKQEKERNEFPMFFAFSNKQFEEGMAQIGLTPADTDKIYSTGSGGYYHKSDAAALRDMVRRHQEQRLAAIASDPDGNGYIYDMFNYELANHEYCITYELDDTLDALGLTLEEVKADPKLWHGLQKARRAQFEEEMA
jgi:hypothetical protein